MDLKNESSWLTVSCKPRPKKTIRVEAQGHGDRLGHVCPPCIGRPLGREVTPDRDIRALAFSLLAHPTARLTPLLMVRGKKRTGRLLP